MKVGDIFALMIRVLRSLQNVEGAYILLDQMKQRVRIQDIPLYLDEPTLQWLGENEQQPSKHSRRETGNSEVPEFLEENAY